MAGQVLKAERFALGDYATQSVVVSGCSLLADASGALFWPAHSVLVVSDLHLEKGSARAARGRMLPPYDTRDTLMRLAHLLDAYAPLTVVCLGDSFHDRDGPNRMSAQDHEILAMLQAGRTWVWVRGNHDPELPDRVGGMVVDEFDVGGLTFRHEPGATGITHEIAGHLHPAAKVVLYGTALRRACFVGNARRLVMPAFGSFTGGLNVLDPAFETVFGAEGFAVWLLGDEGLYPVSTRNLRPD